MVALIMNARLMAGLAAGYVRARIGEERGQDLIEYALLSGVLAVAIGGLALLLVGPFSDMADGIGNCINFVTGDGCG